jgi:hypothetical protein
MRVDGVGIAGRVAPGGVAATGLTQTAQQLVWVGQLRLAPAGDGGRCLVGSCYMFYLSSSPRAPRPSANSALVVSPLRTAAMFGIHAPSSP